MSEELASANKSQSNGWQDLLFSGMARLGGYGLAIGLGFAIRPLVKLYLPGSATNAEVDSTSKTVGALSLVGLALLIWVIASLLGTSKPQEQHSDQVEYHNYSNSPARTGNVPNSIGILILLLFGCAAFGFFAAWILSQTGH